MGRLKVGSLYLFILIILLPSCSPRVAQVSEYTSPPFDLRMLVTPGDPRVQSSLKAILSDNNDVRTDFRRIQDWVAANVIYMRDIQDYWQMPSETLTKKEGDCKDYSTLLCSLWRAYGIPSGDVYVAIGKSRDNKRHAFVIEKYLKGRWQVIEPQVGGFIASDMSAAETAEKYAIMFLFNDIEYNGEPSWIYQKIKNPGGATAVTARPGTKQPLPVIGSFTASPVRVKPGQSVTLNWNVSGAEYVGIDQGIGQVEPVGSAVVTPADSAEYKLVALNSTGSVNSALTVKVMPVTYSQQNSPAPGTPDDQQLPYLVGFTGWYRGTENVQTVNAGQQVTARINLKGGSPGQYFLRAWRAVNTGNDEIVSQWSFIYDGVTASPQMSFAPSYAIGEAGTRGYWLDMVVNSEQVWAMPDMYPPRLTAAPKPTSGPLIIGFVGWHAGSKSNYTVKKGQDLTSGITLTGGEAGRYILHVKSDLAGLSDETLQQINFDYDGSSLIQWVSFIPTQAMNESICRGYYLELFKDGKFVWSLSGSYPPRLTVVR